MQKMMLYGKQYGDADPQLIEGDVFRMIIKVPEFGENPPHTPAPPQVKAHDLSNTERQILMACTQSAQSTPELLKTLGYKSRTGNFKKALSHLLEELAALERTFPDAVRSKNQRYRLTQKGKKILKSKE